MHTSSWGFFIASLVALSPIACSRSSTPEVDSKKSDGDGGQSTSGDGDAAGDGDQAGDGDSSPTMNDDNHYSDPTADTTPRPAPDFGPHVFVFDAAMNPADIQAQVDAIFTEQETAQMGTGRYAFLLHPGNYDLDINVGYYTEVVGLGTSPNDVTVTGAVRAEADWFGGNSTHNFWRSAANLKVVPTVEPGTNRWAVSQAAPFRRMHIMGDMVLDDDGWASGGFIADSIVEGTIRSGSQQQWFTRNSQMGSWNGAVWNMFFLGMDEAPNGFWPPFTIVEDTPVLREKPFLFVNAVGNYYVQIPDVTVGTRGTSWASGATSGRAIALEEFFIAQADRDDATSINNALSAGKNLLLTPGVYHLSEPLVVSEAGTVVLGLGLPTLVAEAGNTLIEVADVDGVKVAGLTIDAGPLVSPTLMRVGSEESTADHEHNPTSLHDIFCRIGGGFVGQAERCLDINSDDVIGDHFWLWRADHGNGVGWTQNESKTGLVVRGDDATIYGLFVEHFQEVQTLWEGEGGRVYFYQCEMPYDPPSQEAWQHDGVNGYPGYKVADFVKTHEAWGLGVYAVFHDAPVAATQAFEIPESPDVTMHHMVTRSLGGNGGEISSVINGFGDAANDQNIGTEIETYPVR